MTHIQESQNKYWGFYGTLNDALGRKNIPESITVQTWEIISVKLLATLLKPTADAETVREYLDSKSGRHLANRIVDNYLSTGVIMVELPSWIQTSFDQFCLQQY